MRFRRHISLLGGLAVWLACASQDAPLQAAGVSLKVGDLLVANYGGNSVLKIDATTGQAQNLGSYVTPTDVAFATNGDLYISQWDGAIYRLNLRDGIQTLVNPNDTLNAVWGLLLEPGSGDLIVTSGAGNSIVRVNSTTGAETVISTGGELSGVAGLAWLDAGHVVVCSTFNNQLVKVALNDGAQTIIPISGGGVDMPRGIAVSGDQIFVTAYDSREVRKLPAAGGTVTTLYQARGFPFGLALEPGGNLIAGTGGAAFEVLRIAPDGALLRSYTDPLISEVTGVQVSPIDLSSTNLTELRLESSAAVGGPYLEETGAVIDPERHVISVEPQPGARFYRIRGSQPVRIVRLWFEAGRALVEYQFI